MLSRGRCSPMPLLSQDLDVERLSVLLSPNGPYQIIFPLTALKISQHDACSYHQILLLLLFFIASGLYHVCLYNTPVCHISFCNTPVINLDKCPWIKFPKSCPLQRTSDNLKNTHNLTVESSVLLLFLGLQAQEAASQATLRELL